MTTRRLRPGPLAPWRGRKGLFGRSAICVSVEGSKRGIDPDGSAQLPSERAPRRSPLEARESPAGVGASPGRGRTGGQLAGRRNEAVELRLRRLAAAADAAPLGLMPRQARPPSPPQSPPA